MRVEVLHEVVGLAQGVPRFGVPTNVTDRTCELAVQSVGAASFGELTGDQTAATVRHDVELEAETWREVGSANHDAFFAGSTDSVG